MLSHTCSRSMLALLVLLIAVERAEAQSAEPATFTLTPGVEPLQGDDGLAFNDTEVISLAVGENRSYSCTLQSATDDGGPLFSSTIEQILDSPTMLGRLTGMITPSLNGPGNIAGYRISFISPAENIIALTATNDGTATPARINCRETSLYGGFNTFASPINFLEVVNTTNDNLEVRVVGVISSNGSSTEFQQVQTIGNDSRFDFNIHDAVGPAQYGTLRVLHDGPFGAVTAHLAEYDVDSAGKLMLRARTPLSVRPNE